MPQRSSWLVVQTLINQHLTDLTIFVELFLTLFYFANNFKFVKNTKNVDIY